MRMLPGKKKRTGFTIVELLIVIVVIAILAAISVVAYTGIQNRAHDTSVQNDLSGLARNYELFKVDDGFYPDTVSELSQLNARINKTAYMESPDVAFNLLMCIYPTAEPSRYAILATSKSGNKYYVTNGGAPVLYTGTVSWANSSHATMCNDLITGAQVIAGSSSGYASGTWRSWTN